MPADAVEPILSDVELLAGQCVIYGVGRLLSIQANEDTWVEGFVLAQEVPTRELHGDVAGSGGRGAFALTAESGSLYFSQIAVLARPGVVAMPDTPSMIPAFEVGVNVTAAYVQGAVPAAQTSMCVPVYLGRLFV